MSGLDAEHERLLAEREHATGWRRWGPFVSERQWGTVREDYSANGTAWDYFPHEEARQRAYRWGEDGIAGWCDVDERIILSLALWNGTDPILKERFFGLTNSEGNHGEDVKELYWYLDATPTHAWNRMVYKYPQRAFPYTKLVEENRRRTRHDPEYELLDTGIFDEDRYFDVFVEYAKPEIDAVVMRVTATNRGPDPATIELIPQCWFRNEWTWDPGLERPSLTLRPDGSIEARHPKLRALRLCAPGTHEALFCENETNPRLWGLAPDGPPLSYKDGIHRRVVLGDAAACAGVTRGTKVGLRHTFTLAPGASASVLVHLGPDEDPDRAMPIPGPGELEEVIAIRSREADAFWEVVQNGVHGSDERAVQRQAYAGLLWSKQFYMLDMRRWFAGDPGQPPPPPQRRWGRNQHWELLSTRSVMCMPDKWEYPWFATWDHAFHLVTLARIDPDEAKDQLKSFLTDALIHPNGAIPAYEWAFDDANPPILGWAAWRTYQIDRKLRGGIGDVEFLVHVLNRLTMAFTWWVNRKDSDGRNVFEGGFLGLDNIGVFDRSRPLPNGGRLQQADGTAWMAMFALSLMRIAIELALTHPVYQDLAVKFFEHFLQIARAMADIGGAGLWNEQDGFYYDIMRLPDGRMIPLKILSVVGLVPLLAVETIEPELLDRLPLFRRRLEYTLRTRPELASLVSRWNEPGRGERRLLSLLRGHRMKCLLRYALDPSHFLSPYGVRGLSRYHAEHPFVLRTNSHEFTVRYEPGESETDVFGGNSNWRGPVWFPVNYLLLESLQKFHHYYGDDFLIECPVGSGKNVTILEAATELARRMRSLFMRGADGRRPAYAYRAKLQNDPHFRDYVHFFEYFHGDTGEGLGAEHQTGWTATVAKLFHPLGSGALPAEHHPQTS